LKKDVAILGGYGIFYGVKDEYPIRKERMVKESKQYIKY